MLRIPAHLFFLFHSLPIKASPMDNERTQSAMDATPSEPREMADAITMEQTQAKWASKISMKVMECLYNDEYHHQTSSEGFTWIFNTGLYELLSLSNNPIGKEAFFKWGTTDVLELFSELITDRMAELETRLEHNTQD